MQIKQYTKYKCRVKIRDVANGQKLKSKTCRDRINGKIGIFEAMWIIDDRRHYCGEVAMSISKEFREEYDIGRFELVWLSSGDLEIMEEVK